MKKLILTAAAAVGFIAFGQETNTVNQATSEIAAQKLQKIEAVQNHICECETCKVINQLVVEMYRDYVKRLQRIEKMRERREKMMGPKNVQGKKPVVPYRSK